MQILKVINNNVISSLDDRLKEVVMMGKGIGYQKKQGDAIDISRVEKIFRLPDEHTNQFEHLVSDMPYEHIAIAEEIIRYAKEALGKHLNKNIYITLTDHLNFAIERQKQGVSFQNALLWEIQKYYSDEYRIGLEAIKMVKDKIDVELPEDEAGFIALHIVNAEMDGDIRQAVNMPGMVKDMINIVRYTFGVDIDETTLSYERFVTHIKFFLQRVVRGECYESDDLEFNRSISGRYPKEYMCAGRIRDYVKAKLGYEVSEEELTYMTVHISRVVGRNRTN